MRFIQAWLTAGERYVWIEYSLLAALIMGPLLAPGYILSLDMVFVPHPPMPDDVSSSYLFHALVHYLSYVVPADWLQKIILFSCLLLSGVGAYKLVAKIGQPKLPGWYWAAHFAGILYMINPFVYGRFMAGQYSVLMGYALLPFVALALIRLIDKPDWRAALQATLLITVVSIVSIHSLGAAVIIGLLIVATKFWQQRHNLAFVKKLGLWVFVSGAGFVALSSYWFVPLLLGKGATADQIQSFGEVDRGAFATEGGDFVGAIANIMRLQGFWVESRGQFVLPQAHVPLWGLLGLAIFGLVICGAVWAWRYQRRDVAVWGTAIVTAGWLAIGTTYGWVGQINFWLTSHIPLLAGYREPHKLVAVVALGYAVLGSYGVAVVVSHLGKNTAMLAAAFLLLIPFIWTPTMFWGFNNQLAASAYPKDWYVVEGLLANNSGKAVFLPWHQYMTFDFAGRIVANPAEAFFGPNMVASHDPEYAGLGPDPAFKDSLWFEKQILPKAKNDTKFGNQLADAGINYVVLAKDDDYQNYTYLDHKTGLSRVFDGANLVLYKVMRTKEAI